MRKTRRVFLAETTMCAAAGVMGLSVAPTAEVEMAHDTPCDLRQDPSEQQPAGAPPAFGTGPGTGPVPTPTTFAEAEKLVQVQLSEAECAQAAKSWRGNMSQLYERRTGPRKVELGPTAAPFSRTVSVLPGEKVTVTRNRFVRSESDPGPLPDKEEDIAFAPVTKLSRWVEQKRLSSERLTQIYLKRIGQYDPKLRCVITLTEELALEQARKADAEIAAGRYRGPLHGIPWGGKDLLDTAGIRTTYGAEPYRDRVPKNDAAVVKRLDAAGAVLIAKLSLGALALNDI